MNSWRARSGTSGKFLRKIKKCPILGWSIDKTPDFRYTKNTKGATGRRFSPGRLQRSNRELGSLGGYFFFIYLLTTVSIITVLLYFRLKI